MKYKITRLDRRMNGHQFYKYHVSPVVQDYHECRADLIAVRNWCWTTYGPSAELGWTTDRNVWCWDTEYTYKRIYLKSDAELALFTLKFST
jgi:hypothetical protein